MRDAEGADRRQRLAGIARLHERLIGPLLAALLLDLSGPEAVFVLIAGLSLWSSLLVSLIDYEPAPRVAPPAPIRIAADTAEGLRAIAAQREVTMLFGLGAVQAVTRGALNVFIVVVAIELLGTGDAGVGILTAAVGVGAVVGSLGVSVLVGSRRLAAYTGLGIALWGAPLALIASFPPSSWRWPCSRSWAPGMPWSTSATSPCSLA